MSRVLLLATLLYVSMGSPATAQYLRYEAETGNLFNVITSSSVSGYSGTGYVTGFSNQDAVEDYFELHVDVPEGLYEMWVGYRSQFGPKGYEYQVDGEFGSGMFDHTSTFSEDRAGLFHLSAGTNTLAIYEGWGFFDVDYLEFRPFTPPAITPIAPVLSDSQASYSTQVLMNYLASQYGSKTLSGQQHESSKNLAFPVQSYLNKSGGMIPAIRASDFIEYSPSRIQFGANPRNETEQSIAWAQQTGGIVTMSWHWNAPANLINQPGKEWWRGFYTYATTFDLPGALANPSSSDYQLLLRDIDAIAVELQKFEDADVPVIWRPLHEAQGGWFWWGDHGPDAFKQLWNLTYDRLTNHHGLHNLIWEFTSSAAEGNHLDWYPGDNVVDMVGLDIYTDPSSSMSGQWYDILEHYDGRKMIALSETGTLPNPELMDQWGIEWSYFSPWSGSFVDAMSAADLQATLSHEDIIILDELPVLPWKQNAIFLEADFNFDGKVDAADVQIWQQAYGSTPAGDIDGDGDSDGRDYLLIQRQFGSISTLTSSSTSVPEPDSLWMVIVFLGILTDVRVVNRKFVTVCEKYIPIKILLSCLKSRMGSKVGKDSQDRVSVVSTTR